jgi:molecular chaperone Hsp33
MSTPYQDELIRVVAEEGGARAIVARTTRAVEELRSIHDTSPTVTAALGRVATGALLMAASLEKVTRREPVLTVEIEGDGPAGKILATASPAGWVRGMARNPAADRPVRGDGKLDVSGVVGTRGTLSVARDLGYGQPYRGVVPLVSGEIAIDLATYLRESEQTPSAVALGVMVVPEGRVSHAGGLLVQLMPGMPEDSAVGLEERLRSLGEVSAQLRSGNGPLEWLGRIFPGGYEISERRPVAFRCGCSLDRVERALKLLGAGEIRQLLEGAAAKPAEVVCEFCRTRYHLPRAELARLLLELGGGPAGAPS